MAPRSTCWLMLPATAEFFNAMPPKARTTSLCFAI
jgi:hypothetical protein